MHLEVRKRRWKIYNQSGKRMKMQITTNITIIPLPKALLGQIRVFIVTKDDFVRIYVFWKDLFYLQWEDGVSINYSFFLDLNLKNLC